MNILFVCTGNICRSPTAEAIMRERAASLGLDWRIDSAGTHGYHIGDPPDSRAIRMAAYKGVDMADLRARQVTAADFDTFDWLFAMDRGHADILMRQCPPMRRAKIRLFLEDAGIPGPSGFDVPDPYYGALEGFESVFDLIDRGVEGVMAALNPLKNSKKLAD